LFFLLTIPLKFTLTILFILKSHLLFFKADEISKIPEPSEAYEAYEA